MDQRRIGVTMTRDIFPSREHAISPEEYNIREQYLRFNKLLFNDELSHELTLGFDNLRARKCRGVFYFQPNPNGQVSVEDCSIKLDTSVEWTRASWDGTLIHEMVHAYCIINLNNQSMENGGHHAQFWEVLNAKNDIARAQFGIEIPTTETAEEDRIQSTKRTNMCLGIYRYKSDPPGVIRLSTMLPSVFDEVLTNFKFKLKTHTADAGSTIGRQRKAAKTATRLHDGNYFLNENFPGWPLYPQLDWDHGVVLYQVQNSELSVKMLRLNMKLSQRFLGKKYWVTNQLGTMVGSEVVHYDPDLYGLVERAKNYITGKLVVKQDGVYVNGNPIHLAAKKPAPPAPYSRLNVDTYSSTKSGMIIGKTVHKKDLPADFMQSPQGQRFRAYILNTKLAKILDMEWTHAEAAADEFDVLLYVKGADEVDYLTRRPAMKLFNDLPEDARKSRAWEYAELIFGCVLDSNWGIYSNIRLTKFLNALETALQMPKGSIMQSMPSVVGEFVPADIFGAIRVAISEEARKSPAVTAAMLNVYRKLELDQQGGKFTPTTIDAPTFLRELIGSSYAFAVAHSMINGIDPYEAAATKYLNSHKDGVIVATSYYITLREKLEAIANHSLTEDDSYVPVRDFADMIARRSQAPKLFVKGSDPHLDTLDVAKDNFDRTGGVLSVNRYNVIKDALAKIEKSGMGALVKDTAHAALSGLDVVEWYVKNIPYSRWDSKTNGYMINGVIDFTDFCKDIAGLGKQLLGLFNLDNLFLTIKELEGKDEYRAYTVGLYLLGGYKLQLPTAFLDAAEDAWEAIVDTAKDGEKSIIPQKAAVPDLLEEAGPRPSSDKDYERKDYSAMTDDEKKSVLRDAELMDGPIGEIADFFNKKYNALPLDQIPDNYRRAFGGYTWYAGQFEPPTNAQVSELVASLNDGDSWRRYKEDWDKLWTNYKPGDTLPANVFGSDSPHGTFESWRGILVGRVRKRYEGVNRMIRQNNRSANFPYIAANPTSEELPAEVTPEEQSILHYFEKDPDWVVYVEDIYKRLLNAEMGKYGIDLLIRRKFVELVNPGQRNESIRMTFTGRAWFDANIAKKTETEDEPEQDEFYLPPGWTEATPGGMATNADPMTGGIIDRNNHGWFIIFNDGRETIDDLYSRAEAFKVFFATPPLGAKLTKTEVEPTKPVDDEPAPKSDEEIDHEVNNPQEPVPTSPEREVKAPKVKVADGKITYNISIGVNEKTKKLMFVPVPQAESNNIGLVRKREAKPIALFLSYVFADDLTRITGRIRSGNRKAAARELAALANCVRPYLVATIHEKTPFPLKLGPLVDRDFGEGIEGQKAFMRFLQGKSTSRKKVYHDIEKLKVLVGIQKPKPGSKEEAALAYDFVGLGYETAATLRFEKVGSWGYKAFGKHSFANVKKHGKEWLVEIRSNVNPDNVFFSEITSRVGDAKELVQRKLPDCDDRVELYYPTLRVEQASAMEWKQTGKDRYELIGKHYYARLRIYRGGWWADVYDTGATKPSSWYGPSPDLNKMQEGVAQTIATQDRIAQEKIDAAEAKNARLSDDSKDTRPVKRHSLNTTFERFCDDLEQNHIKVKQITANSTWSYMATPKGNATVVIQEVGGKPDHAELFWLVAVQRGAGRAALDTICDLADKHGITLELDAIPLKNEQDFKPELNQLVRFYKSFGFKVMGSHKEDKGIKYPHMVRAPKATTETADTKFSPTLEVYHGTARQFTKFDKAERQPTTTKANDVEGFFFTPDAHDAWSHARRAARLEGGKARLVRAHLRFTNPANVTAAIKRYRKTSESYGEAKRKAYAEVDPKVHDGIINDGDLLNYPEYIAFNASSIEIVVKKTETANPGPVIDNINGMGNSPEGLPEEVASRGIRVLMRPTVFLSLAKSLEDEDTTELERLLKEGAAIASPFLKILVPDAWFTGDFSSHAKVVDHDGRHRMKAIKAVFGDVLIEVRLFPYSDQNQFHTREVNVVEWRQALNRRLLSENATSPVI
jgi:hypothetical protein